MQLLPIYQLTILGVQDPGVPNRERIVLRPTEDVNLGEYLLGLGHAEQNESVAPLTDNLYFFGERLVSPPSWVILYTGPGQDLNSKMKGRDDEVHVFHWNKRHTVFNSSSIVPLLLRVDGLGFPPGNRSIERGLQRSLANESQP